MPNWKKFLTAGALVMALGSPALTEEDDGNWWSDWGMGKMMNRWDLGGPMMDYYGPDSMLDRVDGRLAFLKAELKITEEQTPAWDELAGAIRVNAEAHNKLMRSMMNEIHSGAFLKKPLPERLALQETRLEARLDQVKTIKAAVEKLYALLSNEQKQAAADEIVLPMMGMGMGRVRGPGIMFR